MARLEILARVRKGIPERRCNRCEMWWRLDAFARSPQMKDGITGECRLCRAERRARYRAAGMVNP